MGFATYRQRPSSPRKRLRARPDTSTDLHTAHRSSHDIHGKSRALRRVSSTVASSRVLSQHENVPVGDDSFYAIKNLPPSHCGGLFTQTAGEIHLLAGTFRQGRLALRVKRKGAVP